MQKRSLHTRRFRDYAVVLTCAIGVTASFAIGTAQTPPQTATVNQTALTALPASARAVVAAAPLPVLVPMDAQMLQRAEVTTGNGFYSVSSRTEGLTVVVQGSPLGPSTSSVMTAATAPAAARVGQRQVYTTLNEGIRTASWVEGGVAYAIDVECAKAGDARCTADTYVLGLIEKMTFVGGGKR